MCGQKYARLKTNKQLTKFEAWAHNNAQPSFEDSLITYIPHVMGSSCHRIIGQKDTRTSGLGEPSECDFV